MTVPDPHDSRAPSTRRALRGVRERAAQRRAAGADESVSTQPIPIADEPVSTQPIALAQAPSHPPIFKPPPPPLRTGPRPAAASPLIAPVGAAPCRHARRRHLAPAPRRLGARVALAAASVVAVAAGSAALGLTLGPHDSAPHPAVAADVITGSDVTAGATDAATDAPETRAASPEGAADGMRVAPASVPLCATPAFTAALEKHDDAAAIAAAGGGEQFRDAVASGRAPCVSLSDPKRLWVVIDKLRPFRPIDYAPSPLKLPADVRSVEGSSLRGDAADALTRMVKAAGTAGVGEIALESGYRSYQTQHGSYGRQVDMRGTSKADLVSARPGYSEHQSGLAGDMVACDKGRCGTLDDLAATAQGAWIVDHAWEYGWIVRYEKGHTGVTGYLPEPWHLRYIGTDLAKAYRDGGFHTLEQFFGLPDAPDYEH